MNNPTKDHLKVVFQILRYLKMTPRHGLLLKKCDNRKIEIYTDASWARNSIDKRLTTGYYTYV